MSGREELLALAKRVEALTGPCRETDAAILKALGHGALQRKWGWEWRKDDRGLWSSMPSPTASLDAAMSLVPEGKRATISTHSPAAACIGSSQTQAWTYAATPALALTAAALRALAEQQP